MREDAWSLCMDFVLTLNDFVKTFIGLAASEGQKARFIQIGAGPHFSPFAPFLDRLAGYVVDPLLEEGHDSRYVGVRAGIGRGMGVTRLRHLDETAINNGLLPARFRELRSFGLISMLDSGGWLAGMCPNEETRAAIRMLVRETLVACMPLRYLVGRYGIGATDMLAISTAGTELEILEQLSDLPSPPRGLLVDVENLTLIQRQKVMDIFVARNYRPAWISQDLLAGFHDPIREMRRHVPALRQAASLRGQAPAALATLLADCADDLGQPTELERLNTIIDLVEAGRIEDTAPLVEVLVSRTRDREVLQQQLGPLIAEAIRQRAMYVEQGDEARIETMQRIIASLYDKCPAANRWAMGRSTAQLKEPAAARYAHLVLAHEPDDVMALHMAARFATATGLKDEELALRRRFMAQQTDRLLQMYNCLRLIWFYLHGPLNEQTKAAIMHCRNLPLRQSRALYGDPSLQIAHDHCELMLDCLDLDFLNHPQDVAIQPLLLHDHRGRRLDLDQVRQEALREGVRTVLLAAGDDLYLDRYARSFAKSALANSDEPIMVVLHAIGGRDRIEDIAARIGVISERLYYSADDFDDAPYRYTTVNNECTFEKPVAHYQCVRFDVADSLLQGLGLPVIAADIDTLVLGGTSSLSARTDDVILNFNPLATGFAALITANLLRLRPTPGARRFMGAVRAYLRGELAKPKITRWIDQVALLMAKLHCEQNRTPVIIGGFEEKDINNTIYLRFDNYSIRFLSLYSTFDLNSIPAAYR
ncbi:hypothetical protein IP70_23975 [alpha proteobacterium AAP38]|nr:hypothetical protein IP70_23975 [alpha proteobacterium AAP38]